MSQRRMTCTANGAAASQHEHGEAGGDEQGDDGRLKKHAVLRVDQSAVAHADDAMHGARFDDQRVVAGQQYRLAGRREAFEDAHEFPGQRRVEIGRRLVGDDHFRVVDQGAGDGDALLLTAGQPFDLGGAVAELELVEQFARRCDQFCARPAGREGRQDDVFQRRQALDQVELLEDEAEGLAADFGQETLGQAGNILALEADAAAGRPRSGNRRWSAAWSCRNRSGRGRR